MSCNPIRKGDLPTKVMQVQRDYGARAIEAADERLKEEVKTKSHSKVIRGSSSTSGPEVCAKLEFEHSEEALNQACRHRKALKAELEEVKALEAL